MSDERVPSPAVEHYTKGVMNVILGRLREEDDPAARGMSKFQFSATSDAVHEAFRLEDIRLRRIYSVLVDVAYKLKEHGEQGCASCSRSFDAVVALLPAPGDLGSEP